MAATRATAPRPGKNIVLILVDDLGWTDVGCFGSPLYQTPHVDQLAKRGVRFTNAYAPACSCSPSRAGIMTGQFPGHVGMTAIVEKHAGTNAPDDAPWLPATTLPNLPAEETTLAEILQAAGYATCLVGKWHLGDGSHDPRDHGFDVAIAPPHRGAPQSYFWPQWDGNPVLSGRFDGEYLTDRLAEEACDFLKEHADHPFFLYLALHSVHVPIEAKQEKVDRYVSKLRQRAGESLTHTNPYYAGMVESMDEAVGSVVATLAELGLEDDTVVVFFSDNGGLVHRSHRGEHTPSTSNAPLRSGKGFLYEGGIRVPLVVDWPGVSRPGSVCAAPVHGCDLVPTLVEAAAFEATRAEGSDRWDGMRLTTLLTDPQCDMPDRPLFWHYPHFSTMGGRPSGAVRLGRWKLIEHFETGQRELFDLEHDLGETTNLAAIKPQRTERLSRLLASWRESVGARMLDRPNPEYQGENDLGPPRPEAKR